MATHILPESSASDDAPPSLLGLPTSPKPSGGRWIQSSIARPPFAVVNLATLSFGSTYVTARSTDLDSALRAEIAELQLAAAQRFWEFEDSIPNAED